MAKILVVDDEPDIVRYIRRILEPRDHTVITATDGEQALTVAEDNQPDVVVLDLHIPKLDGFEVCKRLKASSATKDVPVVMITAEYVKVEDATHGLEDFGADEYVTKPFLREVLIHNIERLLEAPSN